MLILTIRTDKPMAEIGLFQGDDKLVYETWEAHRQLAETLHVQIAKNLQKQGREMSDIGGIVCFKGPGSFTGLRIGLTVANALAISLSVPVVSGQGETWLEQGLKRLLDGEDEKIALPEYGAEAHITQQRK